MTNPESNVVDMIDQLVEESLALPYSQRSGYDNDVRQPVCGVCSGDFHGLEDEDTGCPGDFATEEQIEEFRDFHPSTYSPYRPARVGASWALGDLPTGTPLEGTPSGGYTLADIERMRGGFSLSHRLPRVRFWMTGEDGMLQEVEGTLQIGSLDYEQGQMSITGQLLPPVIQRLVPMREQSVSDVVGDLLGDAELSVSCQTWVRGQEEHQDAFPVTPVEEMDGGYITAEMAMAPGAGFEPLGCIRPEDFEITTDVDVVESWGGRTLRTHESTTVTFDCQMDRGPAWEAIFGP